MIALIFLVLICCTKEVKIVKTPDELLFEAIDKNDISLLKEAINSGANVNATDLEEEAVYNNGDSALVLTYGSTDFEISKYLIENGAEIDARDIHGNTVLMHSALFADLERVKYLVSHGADVNASAIDGTTPLMNASIADFETIDNDSMERLSTKTVSYLIQHGAEVNANKEDGNTALMNASWSGNLYTVKTLISNGADVNSKDIEGTTPLMYAVGSNKYALLSDREIKMILKIGDALIANSNVSKTHPALTEFNEQIEDLGNTDILGVMELIQTVNYLILMGANVNDRNNNGATALMQAELKGNTEIIEILKKNGARQYPLALDIATDYLITGCQRGDITLIEQALRNGADVNRKKRDYINNSGDTPLEIAINGGYLEVINYLIDNGANQLNESLLFASRKGNLNTVKLLIARGANINYEDEHGKTALKIASVYHKKDVVEYLETFQKGN